MRQNKAKRVNAENMPQSIICPFCGNIKIDRQRVTAYKAWYYCFECNTEIIKDNREVRR